MKALLKKGLILCMACMLVLGMTACGGDSNATTAAKTEATKDAGGESKTTETTTEEASSTKK